LSLTEAAWEKLDENLDLRERLSTGDSVRITANAIKRITKREPRLLTKFDTKGQRPRVLRNATILPVANGEYLILPGDGYHPVESVSSISTWTTSDYSRKLSSLPWEDGPSSESQLIDIAHASGLLGDFLGEAELFLTVRGRLRSPAFEFKFPTNFGETVVDVSGVQVEVDAGYEGEHLNLIEAKLGKWSDFHVRQLYYPVRMWQERLPQKRSRAVFISYSDKVIALRLYDFTPSDDYGALTLTQASDFVLDALDHHIDLQEILTETRPEPAPRGVTFPQADDMAKVLDIVDATSAGVVNTSETMVRYGFTERQALYYPTAARYLGLLEPSGSGRKLSDLGREFSDASRTGRHRMVVARLAALPVFRTALEQAVNNEGALPTTEAIASWIAEESTVAGLPLSGSTLPRRAATVRRWIEWALDVAATKI